MITKFSNIIPIIILLFILTLVAYGDDNQSNRIEVLVNENVITKYDIIQRMKINSILNRIDITDNNYNQLAKAVIDDLIIEKLKKRKIEEYNINLEKGEFEKHETRFYSNFNYNENELKNLFDLNDLNYNYLIEFIEIELQWQKLIYGLYRRVTSVTQQEISELINKNPDISEEIAKEIILQRQLEIKSTKLINDLRDEATIEYK